MANILEIIGTYKDNFTKSFNSSLSGAEKKTKLLSDKLTGLSSLLPQQFHGVANGFDDISSGIGGATKVLGPYGIAVAGAITLGTGLVANGVAIEKEFSTLKKTLGTVDEQMRITAKTTSSTFDVSLQDVGMTTDKISKLFNLTDKNGLEVLRQGMSKTTVSGDDFIKTFNEFSPIFKDMGLNAKQSTALVTELSNRGLGDKGSNAIKEFAGNFTDAGKAQVESLKGIGINYDDLSKKVQSGSMTQFDAMKVVSDKITKLGPDSNEAKIAMKAMFGGPGEDLGTEFQKTLSLVNTNLDELPSKVGDVKGATDKLITSWETFKGVFVGGPDGNWFSQTIASMIDGLTSFLDMFNDIFNAANWTERFKAIANAITSSLLRPLQVLLGGLGQLGEALGIDALTKLNNWITENTQFDINTNKLSGIGKNFSGQSLLSMTGTGKPVKPNNNNIIPPTKDKTKQLAETRDVKSLVINIDNVVGNQYITQNDDPNKVGKLVTKALMTAITDAKIAY